VGDGGVVRRMPSGTACPRLNDHKHWLSDVWLVPTVGFTAAKIVEGRWRIFGIGPPQFLSGTRRVRVHSNHGFTPKSYAASALWVTTARASSNSPFPARHDGRAGSPMRFTSCQTAHDAHESRSGTPMQQRSPCSIGTIGTTDVPMRYERAGTRVARRCDEHHDMAGTGGTKPMAETALATVVMRAGKRRIR